MTYFLLRDYNLLPKKELHWSPWVEGGLCGHTQILEDRTWKATDKRAAAGLRGIPKRNRNLGRS